MAWHKTSRHARGYGTKWDKLRVEVLRRDNGLCQSCLRRDRTALANSVDHIVPKSRGGTDDVRNLEAICPDCHRDKTTREGAEARGATVKDKPRFGIDGWPV